MEIKADSCSPLMRARRMRLSSAVCRFQDGGATIASRSNSARRGLLSSGVFKSMAHPG
jgi:hypothetical protein